MTDDADSPHLLVPRMKAQYLFAIAENDDESEPEVKNVLREAFAKNGLSAEIEEHGRLEGAATGQLLRRIPVLPHHRQQEPCVVPFGHRSSAG